jgi:ribonuclease HII
MLSLPFKNEIGVDEAGRGPLFGRVYVCAMVLPPLTEHTEWSLLIKDSKRFSSEKKLHKVADLVKQHALGYSITFRDHDQIDQINILQATQDAMHEAIIDVSKKLGLLSNDTCLYIDGNYFRPLQGYVETCIKGGDNMRISIAAASILAKVARDQWIYDICSRHPELVEHYGLDKNKGYGTKQHILGIEQHGMSPWHRRSFHLKKDLHYRREEDIYGINHSS